jgi:aspartyl-tRNA(Asn)/glutamyl-tRNA(Gln) amidotransferase subunit B
MVEAGEINSRTAKDLLATVVFEGTDPEKVAEEKGLLQQNSAEALMPLVEQVLAENQAVVEDVKSGNEKAIKFLVGQGMKASKGTANPQTLEKLLQDAIA